MDILLKLAINARKIRVSRGISQEELAFHANIERSYLGYLERGKKNPTVKTLEKLAIALDCTIADFFADVDEDEGLGSTLPAGRRRQEEIEEPVEDPLANPWSDFDFKKGS